MTKDFIPYEEALVLKELGFIEPVIAYFKKEKYKDNPEWLLFPSGDPDIQIRYQQGLQNSHPELGLVSAPLYQQAFRWFRETQGYYSDVFVDDNKTFGFMNTHFTFEGRLDGPINRGYTTYEEAELECLKQLIKIVKKK